MSRKRILWIVVFACCLVVVVAALLALRNKRAPVTEPRSAAVVEVTRRNLSSTLSIAGQFEPYQVVELHAKVSGYIRWIKVDIGDLVHRGEVLADLEVPELQDQLDGAQADVKHTEAEIGRAQSEVVSAQATYSALHLDYTRLAQAAKQRPGLIAQQELDDAESKDQEAQAQVGVAKAALDATRQQLGVSQANSHRYSTLANYEQIVSPFTGVITMRYADVGSLIQAGQTSNTQTMPVVQVSESDLLRLRMPVPENDVPYIKLGGPVSIKVTATGKTFIGKIVRFTRALDPQTRTMLTEVDVPNPDLVLSPGMYAETTIQLQQKANVLTLPAQAVVQNGDQAYVLILNSNNEIERQPVTLGIQTANEIEILTGVQTGERVIASGQSQYQAGEAVTPHAAFIPTTAEEMGN
ncbi:MAG: efflux RND transporter periplasmic adaptor subunit [Acidobacteriaceae bacterium]